jgi:DNA polymerase-3 subunit gamma/tau
MSYQALYRRLRPQRFEDVIGQEHIIKILRNQIENNRINHAYLFCGTRGTGKTTTAKIFARAVNCTSDGSKPCNECEICRDILEGTSTNIIELDAASNNSVDNIREIIDEVRYVPTAGRYRVYIIDEVHMLSNNAFNALLKTLEEPPAHALFILATTDPQKIPITVLSRCQRFDFHRISHSDMVGVLREYMVAEGKAVSEDALNYIAEISDGAMRDALSILDQCISYYYDSEITAEQVREVTGSVDREVFFELTDAVNENNTAVCMQLIEDMLTKGRDIQQFTSDLVLHFRNLLLATSVNKQTLALDYSEDYINKLREQSVRVGFNICCGW